MVAFWVLVLRFNILFFFQQLNLLALLSLLCADLLFLTQVTPAVSAEHFLAGLDFFTFTCPSGRVP